MKINKILSSYESYLDKPITINGWVLTIRKQKDIVFIKLNDGSNPGGIQLIIDLKNIKSIGDTVLDTLNIGSSIQIHGILVKSPAEGQVVEVQVNDLTIHGACDVKDYPLSKSKLPLEYLRNHYHLRCRTSSFGSIFRIKSSISYATQTFFRENGFLHINPNIVTINECEGGAGVFQITENDISLINKLPIDKNNKYDWTRDHFEKPAYLTVSSQLQLEALACSLGSVYTTNKSFRSEHSSTNKHLSEFEHLEIEDTFINIEDLMDLGENYIKYVGNYLLENNLDDLNNLNKFVSKGLLEKINGIVNAKFTRVKYSEAIDILKKASNLTNPVNYGEDLCSEFENYLTEYFNGPVFVSHWPISIKSFYMKQCGNGLCENFDLLMPHKVGELIGGSMREDDLTKLLDIMKIKNISPEPLKFYTDLRKFGSVPHGGFGLGLDRLCMMFTGMENIRDVVAFPISYRNCNY